MKTQILLIICIFLLISYSHALVLRVPSEYPTIQAGINEAVDGDTVLVAPGIYTGVGNSNIYFQGKAILVNSEMGPDSTVLRGDYQHGFRFENEESYSSMLKGFRITRMTHAIYIRSASPFIRDCKIDSCGDWYSNGAGINMQNSSAIIMNCSFSICWINQAFGPAIYSESSNPTIMNSVFYWNSTWDGDAAVYCDEGLIMNCTFYGNFDRGLQGSPDVINCIFWGHEWRDIYGDANVKYSDIEEGWQGEGNISEDPLFVDPENGDFSLLPNSPCIDAGDPDSPNVPWGGFRRDMGAFEFDQGFYFDGQNIIKKPDIPVPKSDITF